MKKLSPIIPVLLLLAACHPDGPINNYSNVSSVNFNGDILLPGIIQPLADIPVPTGASGTLYALNSTCVSDTNPGFLPSGGYAYAWFVNDTIIKKNAGLVMTGSDTLSGVITTASSVYFPSSPFYLYGFNSIISPPIFPNTVSWSVQGDDTTGVPAFNHTDNTAFPTVTGLSVPKSLNVANGLTMHYTLTGVYDAKFYEISTTAGGPLLYTGGSDTSASFSTNQLYTLFPTKGQLITVAIMLAKLTPYSVGNQTFYFVKTSVYSATMTAQ